ncbi:hypothetical protein JCM3765_002796 [Sporobolomyces pararoseus]
MSFQKASFNFNENAEEVVRDEYKIIEPFKGSGYSVPQDIVLAAGPGCRKPPPLSALTPSAINLDQRGLRFPFVTLGSHSTPTKFHVEYIESALKLDKLLASGDWWFAKTLSLITIEYLFDEKAAQHFIGMFWLHLQEICHRINPRLWMPLKEYDQLITRKFFKDLEATDVWRKTEAEKAKKRVAGVEGEVAVKEPAPPKFEKWDDQLFETACRKFGTTSAAVLDFNQLPPSDVTNILSNLSTQASSGSVPAIVSLGEKIEESIRSSVPSSSSIATRTSTPFLDPLPQASFAVGSASAPIGSRSGSAFAGGSFDFGTSAPVHPLDRFAVNSEGNKRRVVEGSNSCGMCGGLDGHFWSLCRNFKPEIVEIRGNGFGLINVPEVQVCNLFNSKKGCTSQACRYMHGCTSCGSTDGSHGNYRCPQNSIVRSPLPTPSQTRAALPQQVIPQTQQQAQASPPQTQSSFEQVNRSDF